MYYGNINYKLKQKRRMVMEINSFITNFAAQFDDTPIEEFSAETEFKAIGGWSSLTALAIIAMVDEEYGVNIKGEDIRKCETIQEIFSIVKTRR
jgi:acyl carrier protein